jgi:ASPM-SPD-2-Hydin domain-containing protein
MAGFRASPNWRLERSGDTARRKYHSVEPAGSCRLHIRRTPAPTTARMYAFVLGGDNHLHVCYWDGARWLWTDLGAVPKMIDISPAAINFGSAPVGDMQSRELTISNVSEASPITVSFPASSSGAFRWQAFNAVIPAGQQRVADIHFSPTNVGSAQTTLTVTSDASGSPHLINLAGRGIGPQPL